MRLFRHGAVGTERAGAVDSSGVMRDLSLLVLDITSDWLSPEKLAALAAIDLTKMPVVAQGARVGAPVGGSRQFIAIGLNYGKHADETGAQRPKEPIVFNKAITSMAGPNDDVIWPEASEQMDWEVELGVIPGAGGTQRLTRFVGKSKAMDMVLTGRMMDAAEAERSGLVARVLPAENFVAEVVKIAQGIASLGAPSVQAAKEAVNRAYETTLSEGVLFERRLFFGLFSTEDQTEGMRAFVEKRPAAFKNR